MTTNKRPVGVKRRGAKVAFLAISLLPVAVETGLGESRVLRLEKKIGVGWSLDKYGWMSFVAFSQDGTMIASDAASAADDVSGNLTLWSFPEGRLIKRLPVRPTAISNDFKYYSTDHGVADVKTGRSLTDLRDTTRAVHAFSPDSHYVAESSHLPNLRNGEIRVLDLASLRVNAFGKHVASALAMSPDDATLASGHWDVVTLWDISTGKPRAVLRGFGRYVEGLSFSRDGSLLAAGTDAGGIQIWDVRRLTKLVSLNIDGGDVSDPAFSPDGRLVAVGIYGTGTVWLIDVSSGKIIDSQRVSGLGCGSVAFSPDGRFLITPSTGGLIKWPYDRGGTIRVFSVASP